jgi:uncharacterized membrane protein HdeD (DUF308 family)
MKNYFVSINGVLSIIFGLVALFFPGITLAALGVYFAITLIIGGSSHIFGAVKNRRMNRRWKIYMLEGIIGIFIGLIILARPEVVATVFVTIMGIWALIIGFMFLFTFFRSRLPVWSNTFVLIVSIISLLTGFIIILNPFESTRIITVLIGIYALIYGLFSVIHSTRK